jgi:hypothetical protein
VNIHQWDYRIHGCIYWLHLFVKDHQPTAKFEAPLRGDKELTVRGDDVSVRGDDAAEEQDEQDDTDEQGGSDEVM